MPEIPGKKSSVSDKFIDQLYQTKTSFTDENGHAIDISKSGFLGLLAMGYRGIALLRNTRKQTHLYAKFTRGKQLKRKKPGAKSS